MNEDEKRNVIIAIVLSIAAVIVIYLWSRGGNTIVQSSTRPETSGVGLTTTPAPALNYVNYNVPAFQAQPPQVIGTQTIAPLSPYGSSGGCGCGPTCGGSNTIQNQSVLNFNQLI